MMMRHRIEMCGAGARGFARRTFDALPPLQEILRFAQNDEWKKTAYQVGDARRENFASPTSGARPHIKRFFAKTQNDSVCR